MVTALVTGGTGFVGAHVAQALAAAGHTPRILRRATSRLAALDGLADYELAVGDVLDPASLVAAMDGCAWVFHVAAVSDYWRQDVDWLYRVNVEGTRHVLQAAQQAGVERFVFTSSAAAVGWRADGQPSDESLPFNLSPRRFPYGHSKFLAEIEVLKAIVAGLDAVIVNPTVVTGPGDLNYGSGSLILEMAKRRVPAVPPGGITMIDVRDVARAHVLAAERGRVAERYLLGSVTLSHQAWMRLISRAAGVPMPFLHMPAWAVRTVATGVDALRKLGVKLPADGMQLRESAEWLRFDCRKSWAELAAPQVDIRQSIQDSVDWYRSHGLLS
ncbi:MAG: NAD-dependent epimerase/dehydratase family protein [Anaerolineae bacterium]|nr:NAD-dependent epimerase/dehydratase family protein [Anaerolineae bacterium]